MTEYKERTENKTKTGQIRILPMLPSDIPTVARIDENTYTTPWSERSFLETIPLDYYIFLKADADGEIAGYCALQQSFEIADITNMTVREEYRRCGIAEMMLRELIRRGKERGVEAFTLEVRRSNAAAIALYTKLGFREEGVRRDYYEAPREDALIMWKREEV